MRNRLFKKYSILFVMWIYIVSAFLQSFSFFDFNKVYAQESQLDYTNLVAIFVDDKIYWSLETNIERYAKTYIQWANNNYRYNSISNSKAIVLPVNTDNITALEITKILENIYFDWISGEPSKLVWVVLIWDIPLPVVNQNWFIYPTIYPYVDFEKQKFIWDDNIKYFVYNNKSKWQAEIRHGLINFDTIDQYRAYFNKLKDYAQNPWEFIDKSIWYEDMIANKKYFFADGLGSYINNFLFAEDIGQKRYSDLMVKIMQWTYNDVVVDITNGMGEVWWDISNAIQSLNDSMNTPTKFIDAIVKEWYLRPYTSLMWIKHLDRIVKNVETANRRIEQITWSDGKTISRTALDTSYSTIEQKDETLLRLKSLVTITASSCVPSSISLRSTSFTAGKSVSTIWMSSLLLFRSRCSMSSPRRPRWRFDESAESATCCNSAKMKWGMMSDPPRKPVSATSAIRPSMMTDVSRIL